MKDILVFKNGRLLKNSSIDFRTMKKTRYIHIDMSNKKWYVQVEPKQTYATFTKDGHMRFHWKGTWNEYYKVRSQNDTRKLLKCKCEAPNTHDYYRIIFKKDNDFQKIKSFWNRTRRTSRTRRTRRTRKSRTR